MTRTTSSSTWAKRLGAVFGASVMAFALVATTAPTAAQAGKNSGTNLSKAPDITHWQDGNFGTKGVKAVAKVPGVDYNNQSWDEAVLGGKAVTVKVATKGFSGGPLTVWIQSFGDVEGNGHTEWRKVTVTPNAKGIVTVKVTPAKVDHCSLILIRVNDKAGNWTEEDFTLKVIAEECEDCTPATW